MRASLKNCKILNIGLRNFNVMFKWKSDKNNQLKLNEIIFFNAWSFKKCKFLIIHNKFLLLIIAGMNKSKLNLNFNFSKPIYLVEFIYIYIYYYLHKLINVLENNK